MYYQKQMNWDLSVTPLIILWLPSKQVFHTAHAEWKLEIKVYPEAYDGDKPKLLINEMSPHQAYYWSMNISR